MEIPILSDILVILGLSVLVILAFQKLKIPTIIGFLFTGVVAGPHGLSLIKASHEVEIFAEIGVILLLFIIGLEFSLKSLAAIKRIVFIGGTFQVVGTILATMGALYVLGMPTSHALFMGFLFSLSSTAIVLKVLQDRGEISSPHGKMALAVLIFQDIIVVPMMLFTPLIAGQAENVWMSLLLLAVKVMGIILVVLYGSRYAVPPLLYAVARTKSKELFILTIVVVCLAIAWLTSELGLSLALGAFLAGLMISESDYSHQATSNILPFREIFTSFFFVSIGMLLDVQFLWSHFLPILGLTALVIVVKAIIASSAAFVLKFPTRTVLLSGMALFQVGEFSFILSKTGIDNGLVSETAYQYFLSISLLTMAITPFMIQYSGRIAEKLMYFPVSKPLRERLRRWQHKEAKDQEGKELKDHLVIIGFGINGKNVARAARFAHIPYVIIELNPELVKEAKAENEPVLYGDAVNDLILRHVNVHKARVVVVAISDPSATKTILSNIRSISKTVYVIIRTRFTEEMEDNFRLGADDVIPEEFETSIEIFTRVLNKYLVPMTDISKFVREIRSANYEMLRPDDHLHRERMPTIEIPNITISCVRVERPDADIVGKTLADSDMRHKHGVTLLAIKRESEFITVVSRDTVLKQEDRLYIVGSPEATAKFNDKVKI
jgi:monovalent cation:H+ antiporter-2, CPA2 family